MERSVTQYRVPLPPGCWVASPPTVYFRIPPLEQNQTFLSVPCQAGPLSCGYMVGPMTVRFAILPEHQEPGRGAVYWDRGPAFLRPACSSCDCSAGQFQSEKEERKGLPPLPPLSPRLPCGLVGGDILQLHVLNSCLICEVGAQKGQGFYTEVEVGALIESGKWFPLCVSVSGVGEKERKGEK